MKIRYVEEYNNIFVLVQSPRIDHKESFKRYIEVTFSCSEAALGAMEKLVGITCL